MNRKNSRNMILLFLVMITIVSLAFGYIYGKEMNNVTMINKNEFEGFGMFREEATPESDLKVKYKFEGGPGKKYVDPNEDSKKNETITEKNVLQGVSSEVPLYQIRFPKNSIKFKPIYMKIIFDGLEIDSASKQGEISVSLYEHKDVKTLDALSYPNYDYNSGYSGKKKKDPDMITMKNVFARKKIYSQTFCESKNTDECGTNTNLKGDTYVIELNKNELPTNTEITDKHVIMIGGNSSIKYETVEIDIIGDYENVESVYIMDKYEEEINSGWVANPYIGEISLEAIKKYLDNINGKITITKIEHKPYLYTHNGNYSEDNLCLDVLHEISFMNSNRILAKYNISLGHLKGDRHYGSKCARVSTNNKNLTYTNNVGMVYDKNGDLKIQIKSVGSGGSKWHHMGGSRYIGIYYTQSYD